MSNPRKPVITRLTPRQDHFLTRSPQFALDFATNVDNRMLLTAAFAEWVATHKTDPAMHYKIEGVNEFLSILLKFGEPTVEIPASERGELEPQG